jgi:membrane protein
MNPFAALEKGWDTLITRSRRRSKVFDHIWTARERYSELLGGRLAAAIAYYGFFAVFALALVAYAIVGFVLANNAAAVDAVNGFLQQNIPFLDATQIAAARNTVAVIGLIGLVFTGVAWIESLRSSQRAIWGFEQQPGNLFIRRAVDLAIMIGIGLLLALSLWVQASINDAVKPVLLWLSPRDVTVGTQETINAIARAIGIVLGLMVNALLAASLLSGVSRLRMSLRRLIPSALLVAVGLSVLSTVGRLYIDFTARRPAYQLVGGTVALLLFLYLFNQLLLYAAALAATSTRGDVVDLAAGPPPAAGDESDGTDDREPSDTSAPEARTDTDEPPPVGMVRADERSMNGASEGASDRRTDAPPMPAAAEREAAAESADDGSGSAAADRPTRHRQSGSPDRRR